MLEDYDDLDSLAERSYALGLIQHLDMLRWLAKGKDVTKIEKANTKAFETLAKLIEAIICPPEDFLGNLILIDCISIRVALQSVIKHIANEEKKEIVDIYPKLKILADKIMKIASNIEAERKDDGARAPGWEYASPTDVFEADEWNATFLEYWMGTALSSIQSRRRGCF